MPWTGNYRLVRPKRGMRDGRIGTVNVRSLYRAGSLTAVARELVGVQGVAETKVGHCKSRGL